MTKMFFKRVAAFLIDVVILFVISLAVAGFVPVFGSVNKENAEYRQYMNKVINQEISSKEFTKKSNELNYIISKATWLTVISGAAIYCAYFVVYQAKTGGQTIGKKLLKIRVVKEDDDMADMKSLLLRAVIHYGIIINAIMLLLLFVANKKIYIKLAMPLSYIQVLVLALSAGMILFGNGQGVHDRVGKTKVEEAI